MQTATDRFADNGLVRAMARTGYLTKGIVYALMGGLALLVVAGERRSMPGGETAVRTIGEQPFGRALLVAAGVGLLCYALWRAVQAVLDPDGAHRRGRRALRRMGYALSGISYGALGVLALQLAAGDRTGHGHAERTFAARALAMDGGAWIVGTVGVLVLLYALHQITIGWTADFMRQLRTEEMSVGMRRAVLWSGRGGIVARGVVFMVIGIGLVRAGVEERSSEAVGIGGALAELARNPFGMMILAVVALGLTLYGVHQLVLARYRCIPER